MTLKSLAARATLGHTSTTFSDEREVFQPNSHDRVATASESDVTRDAVLILTPANGFGLVAYGIRWLCCEAATKNPKIAKKAAWERCGSL